MTTPYKNVMKYIFTQEIDKLTHRSLDAAKYVDSVSWRGDASFDSYFIERKTEARLCEEFIEVLKTLRSLLDE